VMRLTTKFQCSRVSGVSLSGDFMKHGSSRRLAGHESELQPV
jgi:hypothetical protein